MDSPRASLILVLGCYEAIHKPLQVRFGLRRWRTWVVRSSILVPRWLHSTLRTTIRVLVERIWVTLPSLITGSGVGNILWRGIKALKSIRMLNGVKGIVAFNRCMPLHTTGFTNCIDSY